MRFFAAIVYHTCRTPYNTVELHILNRHEYASVGNACLPTSTQSVCCDGTVGRAILNDLNDSFQLNIDQYQICTLIIGHKTVFFYL